MSTKTKVQHSPGPWHVEADYPDHVQDATGSMVVCASPHGDYNNPENKANALLISLAPDMLNVLRMVVDRRDGYWDAAYEIVSKADWQ